jgi:hypothetical protein
MVEVSNTNFVKLLTISLTEIWDGKWCQENHGEGDDVGWLDEALCYEPEGLEFESP